MRLLKIVCFLIFLFFLATNVSAKTVEEIQKEIETYQSELAKLAQQSKTLSNQIAQFDAHINLATLKIAQTEEKITLLGGRIDQLEGSLDALSSAFSSRAVETYKMARVGDPFLIVVSAPDLSEAISRFHYLQRIQEADRDLLQRLQSAQDTYKVEKTDQEELQAEIEKQKANLNAQKKAKADLLAQTRGSEANYQKLLAEARAQLSALSNYARSVGVSLIPHQELSDGWGKYYNQRDSNWGNLLINNQGSGCDGSCTLASVGCLVTAYAMVVSHYGGSVTPADIAVNSSYFSVGTALFNNPGPSANGHSPERVDNPSTDQLRNALNAGKSVIVGLSINGGPYPARYSDHWVVLRSVDGDSFKINDPVYAGAINVSLKDHYSSWTIIQARIYN
jgi:peptidoglycan hydrolase CwlO-like protein